MSACAGTAKPRASVISRSFLITLFISPKFVRLGNGKMIRKLKNLGSERAAVAAGIRSCLREPNH
jgi:hypothetical protein